MDRFSKLVAAAFLAFAGSSAFAGYAYPADPPGFVRTGGTYFQGIGYAVNSANDISYGRVVHQPNGIKVHVPGRPVTMPASYRFAANAPRIAAQIVFMNPALRTAASIAMWLGAAKLIWDASQQKWVDQDANLNSQVSDGLEWAFGNESISGWHKTKEGACSALIAYFNGLGQGVTGFVRDEKCIKVDKVGYSTPYDLKSRGSSCPAGWYVTPAGCVQTPPPSTIETPEEFARRILNPDNQPGWPNVPADWPMPERVPFELPPGTPLPVDDPFINPAPGRNPSHRPLFVPTGDPVRNPNYNPNLQPSPNNQPWIQPGVKIEPSPVPQIDPFRVDIKPVDRPKPDGTPLPGPESGPDPDSNPNPDPDLGENDSGDKPKPEDPPGLCDLYPDILACVKLDKPDSPDIPQSQKEINITPDSGWGADGGTCPPPRQIMVQGRQIPIPFDLFCTYMDGIRPIIIAMAWLSAAFIILGARE